MTSPVRPYLGESAADRVAARRRRMMDVALEQMATDGFEHVTIDSLCKSAKLNKRYFYESFADLDALVAEIVDELAAELTKRAVGAAAEAAVRSFDTAALARHTLGAVVDYLLEDRRRALVLFREVGRSPSAEARRRTTLRQLTQVISTYGHEHHKARGSQPIAEVASAMIMGGTIEVLLAVVDGDIVRTRDQLVEDLAALWVVLGDGAAAIGKARMHAKKA